MHGEREANFKTWRGREYWSARDSGCRYPSYRRSAHADRLSVKIVTRRRERRIKKRQLAHEVE